MVFQDIFRTAYRVHSAFAAEMERHRFELLGGQPANVAGRIQAMIGEVRRIGLRCSPAKGLLFAAMIGDGRITPFDMGKHLFCTKGIGTRFWKRRRPCHRGFRSISHVGMGNLRELGRQWMAHLKVMASQAEIAGNDRPYEDLDAVRQWLGLRL